MAEFPGEPVALVMFDLDGTLVDTVPDIAVALNAALEDLQLPVVSEAQTREWVGNGARVLCGRAISRSSHDDADPERAERLLARFLSRYAERVCVETRPYDGAVESLDALGQAGMRLACITNKPIEHTLKLLDALVLRGHFELVVGGDSLAEKKPHPLPLRHAMSECGVKVNNAIMVGDSATDIDAASAAGIRSVCVSYGYNRGADVHELGACRVIDDLRELPGLMSARVRRETS